MRWLCRLVTPPGGTVLDPFTGSGTTGIAALREGFAFIGIRAGRRVRRGRPRPDHRGRAAHQRRDRELARRRVYTVNITGTGVGRNGIADRLCCHLGHFLAIEIKARSGTLRKLQKWELERVACAGGTAIVARSVADVIAVLDEIEAADARREAA
jgi:hypothetical protein